jgi:hypothetical protein
MRTIIKIDNAALEHLIKKTKDMANALDVDKNDRLKQVQLDAIDQAVYGPDSGLGRAPTLASRFAKTRKSTAPGNPSGGTPVKTGRLQKALTVRGAPFSKYSRRAFKNGVGVSLSANPIGKKGVRYFPIVEAKYGFFGYETSQGSFVTTTMPRLAKRCRELLQEALRGTLKR